MANAEHPRAWRVVDAAFALSAFGWAVRDVLRVLGGASIYVHGLLAALNVVIGVLFLLRRPPVRIGKWGDTAWALVSVISSGTLMAVARDHLAPIQEWLFAGFGVVALISLSNLGGAFSILPADRGVVRRGPYRLVRHPAYAAELAMVFVLAARAPVLQAAPLALLACVSSWLRILGEEKLLLRHADYREYMMKVRYRLIPGLL
ncbi:MAG: protein-S-isoprenylcysteine O-methyltransferase Ste14 [Polyangiales bacterium]|jgi:protein-S-isoprenylcysteine O-methyltransferase Ste14